MHFKIFTNILIEFIGLPTSASVRPHKKAVKKNEAEGAKEKRMLPKLGHFLSPKVALGQGSALLLELVFL
jgi:hypothetical protein